MLKFICLFVAIVYTRAEDNELTILLQKFNSKIKLQFNITVFGDLLLEDNVIDEILNIKFLKLLQEYNLTVLAINEDLKTLVGLAFVNDNLAKFSFKAPQNFINYENVQPLNAHLKSDYPANCVEAMAESQKSGPYFIRADGLIPPHPFIAYCDNDVQGGGWTVIQRRKDGSVDFDRTLFEYKFGFGNLAGEFWLGLAKVFAIGVNVPQELLILLEDWNSTRVYAKYGEFAIGSEAEGYALLSAGRYSGTVRDELSLEVGYNFSTKDVCGPWCVKRTPGGWWSTSGYSHCNLNGRYLEGYYDSTECWGCGINWDTFRGIQYSMKSTQMMIRPTRK